MTITTRSVRAAGGRRDRSMSELEHGTARQPRTQPRRRAARRCPFDKLRDRTAQPHDAAPSAGSGNGGGAQGTRVSQGTGGVNSGRGDRTVYPSTGSGNGYASSRNEDARPASGEESSGNSDGVSRVKRFWMRMRVIRSENWALRRGRTGPRGDHTRGSRQRNL